MNEEGEGKGGLREGGEGEGEGGEGGGRGEEGEGLLKFNADTGRKK